MPSCIRTQTPHLPDADGRVGDMLIRRGLWRMTTNLLVPGPWFASAKNSRFTKLSMIRSLRGPFLTSSIYFQGNKMTLPDIAKSLA
jgi:hypothetical protein